MSNEVSFSSNASVLNTTATTMWCLNSTATTRRGFIDRIIIGSRQTPAENAVTYTLQRQTVDGTPAAEFTPVDMDDRDAAPICILGTGVFSVEPTYTANKVLGVFSKHMRATVQFPFEVGKRPTVPAVVDSGLGLFATSPVSAYTEQFTVLHAE